MCRSYCYFGAQTDVQTQVQATVMTRVAGPLCSVSGSRQYLITAAQSAFQVVSFDNANNIGVSPIYQLSTSSQQSAESSSGGLAPKAAGAVTGLCSLLLLLGVLFCV